MASRRFIALLFAVVLLSAGRGGAAERLQSITPSGMTSQIDVSLTDEPPTAQAIVIITARPTTAE